MVYVAQYRRISLSQKPETDNLASHYSSMTTMIKEHIVVAQNASGRNMHVPLYRFIGDQPGPKVYIQSSIHGAEVQGNVVIHKLIQWLKNHDIKGEWLLIPNCNPVGTNIKAGEYTLGRFDPVNGTNWNRGYYFDEGVVNDFADTIQEQESISSIKQRFRQKIKQCIENRLNEAWGIGLAQRLNLKLQQLAFDADFVLDLHNGPVSTRHIYVPKYAKASASLFNIPHIIYMPQVFSGALDEATFCPWWLLTDKLNSKFGKNLDFEVEAFTLEMGSQEVINFEEGAYDAKSILTYLCAKGCMEKVILPPEDISRKAVELCHYKTLFSQQGGIVEYIAKPGETVKKGQVLARVLNVDELGSNNATTDILAPCDLVAILHFPSASVLSGTQLYKCFTQYVEL